MTVDMDATTPTALVTPLRDMLAASGLAGTITFEMLRPWQLLSGWIFTATTIVPQSRRSNTLVGIMAPACNRAARHCLQCLRLHDVQRPLEEGSRPSSANIMEGSPSALTEDHIPRHVAEGKAHLINVHPLKRSEMQPSYAQDLGTGEVTHGIYGSFIQHAAQSYSMM
ncbi:hypothetical protein HD554DRAFT_1535405 [Boletus coccyginus]|nr:hypothetical protein HD554DRAFT_1535405 [Boletus coccyginus]